MLDTNLSSIILASMLSSIHNAKRPTRLQADEAFFVVGGGRLVVKDAVVTSPKRQFEPGSPHHRSKWDRRCFSSDGPGSSTPGFGPEENDHFAQYSAKQVDFPERGPLSPNVGFGPP